MSTAHVADLKGNLGVPLKFRCHSLNAVGFSGGGGVEAQFMAFPSHLAHAK